MSEKLKLDTLLTDKKSLLAVDWDELLSLREKYPYSHAISMILAKKHYLENRSENSTHFRLASSILDNPVINYAQLHSWNAQKEDDAIPDQKIKDFNRVTEENNEELIKSDENIKLETAIQGELHQKKENTPTPLELLKEVKDAFTIWLLKKDAKVRKIEIGDDRDRSTQLKDDIISESLAEIYVKQGLMKEAIEMYHKLSLKNPNKSAYFAEIIKNLKK